MAPLFSPPEEAIVTPLLDKFPGRERQIRSLATLVYPDAAPCRNLIVHGVSATGKSAIVQALLDRLVQHTPSSSSSSSEDAETNGTQTDNDALLRFAIVNSVQCITGRHLFERIVGAVADALQSEHVPRRCESLAQLTVELVRMLREEVEGGGGPRRFVLVLDAVDRQRDAPVTLLPALARLSEIIPSLTTLFIVTSPPAGLLRSPSSPALHFPPYSKPDLVRILAQNPPEPPLVGTTVRETNDLWTRFCAAVHDALTRSASRSLPSFRASCRALWPRFSAPVVAGTYAPREFSKLLIAARVLFQDESVLNPSIVSVRSINTTTSPTTTTTTTTTAATATTATNNPLAATDLSTLLPTTARLLLLAAYLASHNASRHDLTLFSTHHHARKRRRGGLVSNTGPRPKHRKMARKLLGAHAFVLERMMAVFAAVRAEWAAEEDDGQRGTSVGGNGLDGDVGVALATLASLRLLSRVGVAGDVMDRGGKWRINVGWEVVRGVGRSIGVEVEEWLID